MMQDFHKLLEYQETSGAQNGVRDTILSLELMYVYVRINLDRTDRIGFVQCFMVEVPIWNGYRNVSLLHIIAETKTYKL